MKNNKCEIQTTTETWNKDAHELIDYDSTLLQNSFTVNCPGFIYRKNQVTFETHSLNESSYEKLLEITSNNETYKIIPNKFYAEQNSSSHPHNSAWFVYKGDKCPERGKKYKLNEGDILKFGRLTIRIREIHFASKDKSNNNSYIEVVTKPIVSHNYNSNQNFPFRLVDPLIINQKNKSNKKSRKKICRICYLEEESDDSPLIHPCQCSGTMRYIHLECLRKWLQTRICIKVNSNDDFSSFLIKEVECELCKGKLPDFIKHENKSYELLDFHSMYDNFLLLESLDIDKNRNRYLYMVSLDKNMKIKVGRGHNANLLLNDISVSRVHCHIIRENKSIFIEDNNSKFATLVLVQCNAIKIEENLPLNLQVGRTYIEMKTKKNRSFFSCCSITETTSDNAYQKQNAKANLDFRTKNTIIDDSIDMNENNEESSEEKNNEMVDEEKNDPKLKIVEPIGLDDNNNNIQTIRINKLRMTTICLEENEEVGINRRETNNKKKKDNNSININTNVNNNNNNK